MPSAAQTLLKFTPAAITRTITSNAPGSRYLHLLQLEGLGRLALALGADDPGGHRRGELAGLDVELGDLAGVDGHGRSLPGPQNQSWRLTQNSVSRITVGMIEPADAEEEEGVPGLDVVDQPA